MDETEKKVFENKYLRDQIHKTLFGGVLEHKSYTWKETLINWAELSFPYFFKKDVNG